jgi:hypothetical protein
MLDIRVSQVGLGDKAGLTVAFLREIWSSSIWHPNLNRAKTGQAQRVAVPLNSCIDICRRHFSPLKTLHETL